jgi:long-chain acyl-CoA synthetase
VRPAPWLDHYDPGVPASLEPYPQRTVLDYVADHARDRPGSVAVLFKGAKLTFSELERLSDGFAGGLAQLQVARGDRVGLLLPNCPQFLIAELGAWKAGAIVAALNPTLSDRELIDAIVDEGIETLVVLTRFYERIKTFAAKTQLRRIIATNIKEFFPPLLRLLFTIAREKRDGDRVVLRNGDLHFQNLVRAGSPRPPVHVAPSDPAVLLLSGGTTGTPKGVLGCHSAYVMAGLQIQAWAASVVQQGDVVFLPLPLFHVYANVGVQPFALIGGNPLALVPNPRDLADVVATVRRVKPAFFNGVPTLYTALVGHPDVQSGRADFKSIKICFSGASALMAETKQRFESITGGRIVEGYSLTEAMMALAVNPVRGENKIGSVGMPLPDVEIRIFDADEGERELPTGEVGEICIAAPQLMAGFWNKPGETALVIREHAVSQDRPQTSGYLHTGDLGYLDDDGYVFIVDRKKDLIKTSGFQVWPREVEEVLASHPAVAEVGVVGFADDVKGEAVRAFVVLRANQTATEAELRTYCRRQLAPYKVPSKIEFRTDLPKTMVGKVLRRALRNEF